MPAREDWSQDPDLTDGELDRYLQSVPVVRYEPRDLQRMARELKRRRLLEPLGPVTCPGGC